MNLENSQVKTVVKNKDSSKALPKIQEKKVKLKKGGATEKQSNVHVYRSRNMYTYRLSLCQPFALAICLFLVKY